MFTYLTHASLGMPCPTCASHDCTRSSRCWWKNAPHHDEKCVETTRTKKLRDANPTRREKTNKTTCPTQDHNLHCHTEERDESISRENRPGSNLTSGRTYTLKRSSGSSALPSAHVWQNCREPLSCLGSLRKCTQ